MPGKEGVIDFRVQTNELERLSAVGILVQQQLSPRSVTAVDGKVDAFFLHRRTGRMAAAWVGLVGIGWFAHHELHRGIIERC